jgi:hypothetical protein
MIQEQCRRGHSDIAGMFCSRTAISLNLPLEHNPPRRRSLRHQVRSHRGPSPVKTLIPNPTRIQGYFLTPMPPTPFQTRRNPCRCQSRRLTQA